MLFKDAPDLLAEFKDFLPEAVPPGMGGVAILPQPPNASWGPGESSPPSMPAKKPAATNKRNRKRPEKEATPVPPPKPVATASRVCLRLLKFTRILLTISIEQEGQTSTCAGERPSQLFTIQSAPLSSTNPSLPP